MLKSAEAENLLEYMEISNNPLVNKVCADLIKVHETMDLYPICVPSYNVTPKRRLIYNLVEEGLPFTVYAYSDQVDRYKEIGCTDIFEIDAEIRKQYKHPVSVKLNKMIEHQREHGHNVIFRLDDDINQTSLEVLGDEVTQFKISMNTALHIMQFIRDTYKMDSVCMGGKALVKWNYTRKDYQSLSIPIIPGPLFVGVLMNTDNVVLSQNRFDDQVLSVEKVCKYKKRIGVVPVIMQIASTASTINAKNRNWVSRSSVDLFRMYGPKTVKLSCTHHKTSKVPWLWAMLVNNVSDWEINPIDIPEDAIDELFTKVLPNTKSGTRFNLKKYLLDAANLNKETE